MRHLSGSEVPDDQGIGRRGRRAVVDPVAGGPSLLVELVELAVEGGETGAVVERQRPPPKPVQQRGQDIFVDGLRARELAAGLSSQLWVAVVDEVVLGWAGPADPG